MIRHSADLERRRRGRVAVLLVLVMGALLGGAVAAQGAETLGRDHQIDLNRASLEELRQLPLPGAVVEAIYDYRTYVAYFSSLYELLKVKGITPELLVALRDQLFITPVFEVKKDEIREEEQRTEERYYLVQRLLSEEGANEGLVDEYVDQLKDPRNVNRLDFYDLVSYQNVSPVDAVAVLTEKNLAGKIENARQMRSAGGLTYFGFRNLRDFVRYDDSVQKTRITGDYQLRLYNTPYLLDDADILVESFGGAISDFDLNTYAGRLQIGASRPYLTNKLRLNTARGLKFGAITHRNMGEESWAETNKFYVEFSARKGIPTPLGKFRLNSAVLGNYAVSFGQGLVMDNTDFFSSRRTGYGYNPRYLGLRGDLSRTDEYALKGGALDANLGRVRGTFFYSKDDKDAILNPNGSFNSYFTMTPRLSNDLMADIQADISAGRLTGDSLAFQPMRDVMQEQVTGGNVKFELRPGTFVGVTGVEMKYKNNVYSAAEKGDVVDRWDPRPLTLAIEQIRLEDRDRELYDRYNSVNLGPYRRVWGAEAQTVFNNVSLAGEYGKLEKSNSGNFLGRIFDRGPEAWVVHGYVQYEAFNFLALYRDYDLGYDNPYNRAFAENSKYKQTLIDGNAFRLKNPYWAQLALKEPESKGERGWYFSTRYQPARQFLVAGLEFDTWERLADGADQRRLTLRAEYRPIFPVRLLVRHRISSRHEQRLEDVRRFLSWDTRIEMRANLSKFDQIRFLYSTSNVQFTDRGRLTAPATGGDTSVNLTGEAGSPAKAIQAAFTHNFNDYLSATLSTEIYDGFLYNFEDNEFIVVDGAGFRNWLMVRSRLSEKVSWRFKWTTDHQLARTFVDIRNFGNLLAPTPDGTDAREDQSSYRFQLDYSF